MRGLKLVENSLRDGYFPYKRKCADVSPVFKKDDLTKAQNYRPVSVLPGASKIFERLMNEQISFYIDQFLSFDSINHDLLIAKLHVYGFSKESLKLIKSYVTNRWQRTKLNTGFGKYTEILLGVLQGSVLGPLFFNTYINDLFLLTENTNICNYANDTTFYACDSDLNYLISRLEHGSVLPVKWFECNYMKLNQNKCHLLMSGHK